MRHAFKKAIQWKWCDSNPLIGVKSNPEQPRDRHLSLSELASFKAALNRKTETPSILVIQFILLTGCRKGEALNASWDQFDIVNGHWTKPSSHTKQRHVHRVPLSTSAVEILQRAKAISNGEIVFPGKTGKPLTDIKKSFASLLDEAEIKGLRVHDLRHSFASILASSGTDLHVVGKLLGHTQAVTTLRYAHYFDEPLRDATEIMSNAARNND